MRQPERWKPSKIEVRPTAAGPRIRALSDPSLGAGSTLMATLVGRWYAMALPQHAHGTMLELGAGAMPYHALYRERCDAVWASDWPASLHRQPHADLFCDLNAGLPLRDAVADTVLLADVLEHIYRPQALLAEVRRVLRPGGALLLNTPFMYWVHEAPHDYFRYTPHALQRLADDAGLQVARLDAVGGSGCVLADVAGKLLQSVRLVGAPLARALQCAVLALSSELPLSASSPLFVAAVLRRPA